ncbi:MAG: c-type cytochrome [Pirellulaceae bacterium]|nr:c-type cytochrome [Pirellulaceae bacterium]
MLAPWLIHAALALAADDQLPQVFDDRLQLQLVAEAPHIVTPTGIAVDERGRILVIESHTHFPPKNYDRPQVDRILLLDDFDPATGQARRSAVFYEGPTHAMNLALYRDGSVFVATRREIFRLWDADGDGKAEKRTEVCHLETSGNYPHNGLSGFAFDFAGNVYFGFGENLGADYKLLGSDGKTLAGGGEGGNIYACDPDGKQLRRVATGFWNPFHLGFDAFGRLFTVDNDPDSRPPCRLLHVVEGGDYGYRFRNGRRGVHPFTAWNGELPGTLPMVSGTGEAPSAVLAYESDNLPAEYRGDLFVTSWGDHRIERYRPRPHGASFQAEMTTVVRGGENFRPVGLALAPDGSLVFSDWVDKSYQLHGKGRVWRLSAKQPAVPQRPADLVAALESPHGPWREVAARKLSRAQALAVVRDSKSERARSLAARALFAANARWTTALQNHAAADGAEPAAVLANLERFAETTARLRPESFAAMAKVGEALSKVLAGEGEGIDPLTTLKGWNPEELLAAGQPAELRAAALAVLRNPDDDSDDTRDLLADPFAQAWLIDSQARALALSKGDAATTSAGPILRAILKLPPPQTRLASLRESLARTDTRSLHVRRMLALSLRQADNPSLRPLAGDLLKSSDEVLRLVGVLWIGEARLGEHQAALEALLHGSSGSKQLFSCALAALDMLAGKHPTDSKNESPGDDFVLRLLTSDGTSAEARRFALRMLPPDHPKLTTELLTKLLAAADESVRLEVIRTLRQRADGDRWPQLREIAANAKLSSTERAEAVVGLSPGNQDDRKLLLELAGSSTDEVAGEALRALRGFDLTPAEREQLTSLAAKTTNPATRELVDRALARNPPKDQPAASDNAAWLARAEGPGNARAGERIFFHPRVAGCFRCHEYEGRGYKVGPDLSTTGRTLSRERLVQSIVDPSREIAPQFTNWSLLLADGRVLTGIHVGDEVDGRIRFADPNGRAFHVHPNDIDQRQPSSQSLMPANLAENMTPQELRDLLAYLSGHAAK